MWKVWVWRLKLGAYLRHTNNKILGVVSPKGDNSEILKVFLHSSPGPTASFWQFFYRNWKIVGQIISQIRPWLKLVTTHLFVLLLPQYLYVMVRGSFCVHQVTIIWVRDISWWESGKNHNSDKKNNITQRGHKFYCVLIIFFYFWGYILYILVHLLK